MVRLANAMVLSGSSIRPGLGSHQAMVLRQGTLAADIGIDIHIPYSLREERDAPWC
jgi:hypothetical protein